MGEHEAHPEAAAASAGWARGEDRSGYQPAGESWAGNSFGFTKFTEATNFEDPAAAANWATLEREGLPRGGYHFFHPSISPIDQGRFFAGVAHRLGLRPGDMLFADVEITVGAAGEFVTAPHAYSRMHLPSLLTSLPPPRSVSVVDNSARLFLDTVASLVDTARNPLLVYTDGSIAPSLSSCAGYGLFIAWYSSTPPPDQVGAWRNWLFWQKEAGGGIGGGDLDYFHGDETALMAWLAPYRGGAPPPPQPRQPRIPSKTGDDDMTFYLPNGDGAEVAVDLPLGVPGKLADGSLGLVPVRHLALNVTAASTVHVTWNAGGTLSAESAVKCDWNRTPTLVPVAPDSGSVLLRRERGVNDPVVVTASWRG